MADGEVAGGGSHSHENSPVAEGARTVEVRGTSYAFTPNRLTAEAGEDLAIRLTSADIEHDLVVEGTDGHVYAAAGETAVGGLTAPSPGTYVVYCSIDGHRDSGMEGVLTVS